MVARMSHVKPLFSATSEILMVLFGLLKPVQRDLVVMWDCCTDISRIYGFIALLMVVRRRDVQCLQHYLIVLTVRSGYEIAYFNNQLKKVVSAT